MKGPSNKEEKEKLVPTTKKLSYKNANPSNSKKTSPNNTTQSLLSYWLSPPSSQSSTKVSNNQERSNENNQTIFTVNDDEFTISPEKKPPPIFHPSSSLYLIGKSGFEKKKTKSPPAKNEQLEKIWEKLEEVVSQSNFGAGNDDTDDNNDKSGRTKINVDVGVDSEGERQQRQKKMRKISTTTTTTTTTTHFQPLTSSTSPTSTTSTISLPPSKAKYSRFLVLEISYEEFNGNIQHSQTKLLPNQLKRTSSSSTLRQKVLRLFDEVNSGEAFVTLRDEWFDTPASPGHYVHIIGDFDPVTNHLECSQFCRNLIILHPDILLSGTLVGGSFTCVRRSVLGEKLKEYGESTAALFGQIAHSIFQAALSSNNFELSNLQTLTSREIKWNLISLYSCGETDETSKEKIASMLPAMIEWSKFFLPSQESNSICFGSESKTVKVSKVLAIEESVWSPTFGIKGKIDASIEVNLYDSSVPYTQSLKPQETKTLPLELKTGAKNSYSAAAHKAQVILYTLIMSDRYNHTINDAIVYYLKNPNIGGDLSKSSSLMGSSNNSINNNNNNNNNNHNSHGGNDSKNNNGNDKDYLARSNSGNLSRSDSNLSSYGLVTGYKVDPNEVRSIMVGRNKLAHYLHNSSQTGLPPMLTDKRTCEKCFQKDVCFLYHKGIEGGDKETSGVGDLFELKTDHLSEIHKDYLKLWNTMISLESDLSLNSHREIWTMPSKNRELLGTCAGEMVIHDVKPFLDGLGGYEYTFVKCEHERDESKDNHNKNYNSNPTKYQYPTSSQGQDDEDFESQSQDEDTAKKDIALPTTLLEGRLSSGDYVVVSTEEGHFGIGSGVVRKIGKKMVVIYTRDQIFEPPSVIDESANVKRFHGIIDIENIHTTSKPRGKSWSDTHSKVNNTKIPTSRKRVLWRIDKGEMSSNSAVIRSNLFKMFEKDQGSRLRSLIVDLASPTFNWSNNNNNNNNVNTNNSSYSSSSSTKRSPNDVSALEEEEFEGLDIDQKNAIKKVLAAQDYALIQGLPGTGKTTTISRLIAVLNKLGRSVLITSYTHSAVDTLLLKLAEMGIDFLRVGGSSQVPFNVKKYTLEMGGFETIKELDNFISGKRIVATSCLGITHPIFTMNGGRKFDFCIIDEASQITQPTCLGPILHADIFVLVGDHYQLPPLIRSQDARNMGMDISLFRRLGEAHSQSIAQLHHNYRMNSDIMLLANKLIYNNRLKCGTNEIKDWCLQLNMNACGDETPAWVREIVNPERRVLFVNIDEITGTETRLGDAITNDVEAEVVGFLTQTFIQAGLPMENLGIISPYLSQLKIIKQSIHSHLLQHPNTQISPDSNSSFSSSLSKIEVHTVDKYQGRDKDCIVFSLVRRNSTQNVGSLLSDWRRVNVAFTRAKKKLVVIGSMSTLSGNHLFEIFIKLAKEKGWIYTLPTDALDFEILTPTTTTNESFSKLNTRDEENDIKLKKASLLLKQPPLVKKDTPQALSKSLLNNSMKVEKDKDSKINNKSNDKITNDITTPSSSMPSNPNPNTINTKRGRASILKG